MVVSTIGRVSASVTRALDEHGHRHVNRCSFAPVTRSYRRFVTRQYRVGVLISNGVLIPYRGFNFLQVAQTLILKQVRINESCMKVQVFFTRILQQAKNMNIAPTQVIISQLNLLENDK